MDRTSTERRVNPRKSVRRDFSDLVVIAHTPSASAVCTRETGNEVCMAISIQILYPIIY